MTKSYGVSHSALSLAERSGNLSQFGGALPSVLEDGSGRGTRVLDFNTGSGLRFAVNVDRALDISALSHIGRTIGRHSAAGTRHPPLYQSHQQGAK